MRYINGYPGQAPRRIGLSLGDSIAGTFAVQGILAALHERSASGLGQEIDISLIESCLAMMESSVAEYDRLDKIREPAGTRIPGVSPSNVFRTLEGTWFVIAASQARMFERLCRAMGRPELSTDPRFNTYDGRRENQEELENMVGEWVATMERDALQSLMNEHEIAAGPVNNIAEVLADEQLQERRAFASHSDDVTGEFLAQGVTPLFSRTPGGVRWSGSWTPGVDNREVFCRLLGMDDQAFKDLVERRII